VVPVTIIERWFDVVAMLLGGLIFGYIIGAIGNLVQQASAKENEYHMAMNELDIFMNEMKLPLLMRTEISNYFQRLHTRSGSPMKTRPVANRLPSPPPLSQLDVQRKNTQLHALLSWRRSVRTACAADGAGGETCSLDVNTYHYYTDLLSPALKAKLLLYMNKTWITRVPHFQGAPQDFIVQVKPTRRRFRP
jgi:hypothetical protein